MIQVDEAKQERTMASGKRARKLEDWGLEYHNYWRIVCRISSSTPKSSNTFNALQSFKQIMLVIQFVFLSPFESGEGRSMLASAIQTGQPLNSTGTCTAFYHAVRGETCASLVATQKLTQVQIFELNPGLPCKGLTEDQAICVKGMSTRCAHRISVNAGQSNYPTCASIVAANNITSDTFNVLNPGLSCPEASGNNNAWPSNSTAVCVSPGLGKIFFEYIGAYNSSVLDRSSFELTGKPVAFTDLQPLVQTYPTVVYYFILAFAIDFDCSSGVSSENNNGTFYPYWNPQLTPAAIRAFKTANPGVQVLMSLGGDSVSYPKVRSITWIDPKNITEWVDAAEASIVAIVEEYFIDGLDIYYRNFDFRGSPLNFSFCMGELITRLKGNNTIALATISPAQLDEYNNDPNGSVIQHYQALMSSYGDLIDYVNFQTDAFDNGSHNWQTPEYIQQFDSLTTLFDPWKLTASSTFKNGFSSANPPEFVDCLHQIQEARGLPGVMLFEADDTVNLNFTYEKDALALLSGLPNSEIVLVSSPVSSSRRILPSTWCGVAIAVCCFSVNFARWPLTQKGW